MNYTFNDADIALVERFIELKKKGYYCDGKQLTEVYNRVLHKNVNSTQCGSCLRQRIGELEQALNHFKAQLAKTTEAKEEPVVEEELPKRSPVKRKKKGE